MADQVTSSLAQAKVLVMEGQKGADGKSPYIGANGNWFVWNGTAWVDTGIPASLDDAQIAAAVEEYLEEHPVEVPVDSVNGKTGTVVLDAEDVGALPADTDIPAEVTEQTVAGWGFTKNTGTYSKPSGGIPASDLAPGVIPVVPQMATQAGMSDWTSGKTVDAATLKTNFIGALTLLSEKADISDIPTAVSELTNDSGFQTAAQVQSAIAAIPDELPDTTSASANDFLCLNAQKQPIWKTVPSAESNSFGGGS